MRLDVVFDREEDGRWIAVVEALPGVIVYGQSREEALQNAQVLALQVIADKIAHHELTLDNEVAFVVAAA